MVNPWSVTHDAIEDQNCCRRKITLGWALLNTSLASSPLYHDNFENIQKTEMMMMVVMMMIIVVIVMMMMMTHLVRAWYSLFPS